MTQYIERRIGEGESLCRIFRKPSDIVHIDKGPQPVGPAAVSYRPAIEGSNAQPNAGNSIENPRVVGQVLSCSIGHIETVGESDYDIIFIAVTLIETARHELPQIGQVICSKA